MITYHHTFIVNMTEIFCSGKRSTEQKENKHKFLFHLYSMSIENFKFLSIYITAVNCTKIKLTSSILVPLSFLLKRVVEKYAACSVQSNHFVSTITKIYKYLIFKICLFSWPWVHLKGQQMFKEAKPPQQP